jgi:hypothetical protein
MPWDLTAFSKGAIGVGFCCEEMWGKRSRGAFLEVANGVRRGDQPRPSGSRANEFGEVHFYDADLAVNENGPQLTALGELLDPRGPDAQQE